MASVASPGAGGGGSDGGGGGGDAYIDFGTEENARAAETPGDGGESEQSMPECGKDNRIVESVRYRK